MKKEKTLVMSLLLLIGLLGSACERDTTLEIVSGEPLKFILRGSGSLGRLRIRGPKQQREGGENASIYWAIEPKDHDRNVEDLSPIVYGQVPKSYVQVYPEQGEAPPLVDGERYYINVDTNDANGVREYFVIRNGNVEVSGAL